MRDYNEHRRAQRICRHEKPKGAALKRREETRGDLAAWLLAFDPNAYPMPFSKDHLKVLKKLESCIINGGLFAQAMPRGSGKTTMSIGAAAFGMLNGYQKFIALIGSDEQAAVDMLTGVKSMLEYNDALAESYPEVCNYIRHAQGQARKAQFQLAENGESSRLQWKTKEIIMPDVHDSECAGSVMTCRGITGKIRGMRHVLKSGEVLRPTFAVCDDPQTRESANSPSQCATRLRTIRGDVLGLSGPGEKMSCVIPCTIIYNDDLAAMVLDRKKSPEFIGETCRMVYAWPEKTELWETYIEQRREEFENDDTAHEKSNAYYSDNREAMDAGAEVAWPERFDSNEISAIQHAYNLLSDLGEDAFHSEYQNDPKILRSTEYEINRDLVASRCNGLQRLHAPAGAVLSTAMIDINYHGLHWVATAWKRDLTGYVMDYGKHPGGRSKLVSDPGKLSETQIENLIWGGLTTLTAALASRPWMQDGEKHRLELITIDCGRWTSLVMRWIAQNSLPGIRVIASRGFGNSKYKQINAIAAGDNWHRSKFKMGQAISHNADVWRMRTQKAFLNEPGAPGSISLYGSKPADHKLFAAQIVSEQLIEYVESENEKFYKWSLSTGSWNDLLDALVGSLVGASACGLGTRSNPRRSRPRRKRISTIKI